MPFHTCGPSEAFVVSGAFLSQPKIVVGGACYVYPLVQKVQKLSLNVMTLHIQSSHVYTLEGVPLNVMGIAQVKIESGNRELLRTAVGHFLGKTSDEIAAIALNTLEGHQRGILGSMTVEEIYSDRKKFGTAVLHVATPDLTQLGIAVVSYTLKEISDDTGYLLSLGLSRTAQVKRDATIGQADAQAESGIKEALANQANQVAKFENETQVAKASRDFEVKQLVFAREVNSRKAESDLAYQLQSAKTKQKIKAEELQIEVVARKKQIEVARQEVSRREKELEARVRKPVLAEKYRIEMDAEAQKRKVILEAEAQAEAIRTRGEAEAFAIREKARAEAEQMLKKAEAWEEYKEAALVDMVLKTLPKVAAELAAPMTTNRSTITMVSSGDGDDPSGPSKITGEVLRMIGSLPTVVETMTGVNISETISKALAQAQTCADPSQELPEQSSGEEPSSSSYAKLTVR